MLNESPFRLSQFSAEGKQVEITGLIIQGFLSLIVRIGVSERKKAKKGVTVHTEQCDTAACHFQIELANLHITSMAVPFFHSHAVLLKTENGQGALPMPRAIYSIRC